MSANDETPLTLIKPTPIPNDNEPDESLVQQKLANLIANEEAKRRFQKLNQETSLPWDTAVDLEDFVIGDIPEYDWLIPNFLEKMDRLILVGEEGHGKTTLLRQLSVQAALGIHPFTLESIDRITTLHIDLENPITEIKRSTKRLFDLSDNKYKKGSFFLQSRPGGMDLFDELDRESLERDIEQAKPQLVTIGPMYKMTKQSLVDEEAALAIVSTLDELRTRYNFALMIETHPRQKAISERRPEHPYGHSIFRRWPELGLFLAKEGELRHWRGARGARSTIPEKLKRGIESEWPWTVDENRAITTQEPTGRKADLIKYVRDMKEKEISKSKLADVVTGNKQSNLGLIDELVSDGIFDIRKEGTHDKAPQYVSLSLQGTL